MPGNNVPSEDLSAWFEAAEAMAAEGLPDLANETLGECHVPLKVPFTFKDFAYLWAPLRVPTGRDWREWYGLPEKERTDHAWLKQVLAAPVEILDVMHAADYVACLNAASRLLHPGAQPPTA
jgi:hypothetical protein